MAENVDLIGSFHSWEISSDNIAIKNTDKSVFLHHGTGIPQGIYAFFNIADIEEGGRRAVSLIHTTGTYAATFTRVNNRIRLLWKKDLTNLLQTLFPSVYSDYVQGVESSISPSIWFKSLANNDDSYMIEFHESDAGLVEKKRRNPRWTRDELILALDLYFREPAAHGNSSHPAVIELSDLLNALPLHKGQDINEKYRNPNGVGMKLANFRGFDPDYDKGLSNIGRLDREVWDDFSDDINRLHKVAETIKSNYSDISSADELEDDEDSEATEGKILTRLHHKRERSAKLIKKKKQQVLNQTGKLECEICGFDFERIYGEHGTGFIECHHKKPVSEIKEGETTKLSDLAVVCANCHRMIHKSRPWLSIEKVTSLLKLEF